MLIALPVVAEAPTDAEVLGLPVFAGRRLPAGSTVALDIDYLADRGFEGKVGEACPMPGDGPTAVAVGVGEESEVDAETLRRAAAAFVKAAWRNRRAALSLLNVLPPGLGRPRAAQAVAEGVLLSAYRFTAYKSDPKACRLESVALVGTSAEAVIEGTAQDPSVAVAVDAGGRVAEAVALARDLVNEPAGAMTPERLAEVATEIAGREGLAVTVLDETAIAAERLGGLLGVAAGSSRPPRLIELVYDPPGAKATVALVGKGITFDSGGLSIKTAEGMETMKTDMSGAAAVLAAMSALPALGVGVKVIGILPTTENMPSGTATKPGDVLRIRNGTTVEVLNTDAEGRLVLADGLTLAVESGADAIVDVATLTGACVVALGRKVAGLMGNDEELVAAIRAAAERAGEAVWPLPLPDDYRKEIDSDVADIKNITGNRYGGALTAGLFLKEFVGDRPWAHLDIAGPARSDDGEGYVPKGGTGFGVRTLLELVANFDRGPAAANNVVLQ